MAFLKEGELIDYYFSDSEEWVEGSVVRSDRTKDWYTVKFTPAEKSNKRRKRKGTLSVLILPDSIGQRWREHLHDQICGVCKEGGELLLCDSCTRCFHLACLDLAIVPKGAWQCDECEPAAAASLSSSPEIFASARPSTGGKTSRAKKTVSIPNKTKKTPPQISVKAEKPPPKPIAVDSAGDGQQHEQPQLHPIVASLQALAQLRAQGHLSKEDFAAAKARVLSDYRGADGDRRAGDTDGEED
jgi:hypothetical protein